MHPRAMSRKRSFVRQTPRGPTNPAYMHQAREDSETSTNSLAQLWQSQRRQIGS
jgi:hypothetical protein